MVFPNKNYPGRAIVENKWEIKDVEKEFRAQIELALKYIPRISHVSAHMGCTNLSPEVRALTKKLAAEYHIPIDPEPGSLENIGYDGPSKTPSEKLTSFINMLNKLEPGKTYLFIDHPGLNNDELKAVYHIGYENVAEDRQGVTDLYTNEKVKAFIKQKAIRLIGYRDLVK
jgi:chitin disaccharide deacetylase